METSVSVEDLVVHRGRALVLPGLSLQLPAGKVTGVLGPSGSGKSTLFRALVGVQKITSGQVTILGEPAGSPQLRRRVGYSTQSPSAYDDLSIADNVGYFASLVGAPSDSVARVLDDVDLADARTQLFRNLSGGQRSRVSLACALVGSPEVIVLDEPTVGLDPVLRRELWNLFHRLADEGRTLVVSSHVMDEAARCDDLVLIRDGKIVAHEPLPSLLERTGTTDAEAAFLALIDEESVA